MRVRFSDAAGRIESSGAVTDILKLAERPDVLSLAGGMPDPAVFRIEDTAEAMDAVLSRAGAAALNYSPNPGVTELREHLAERSRRLFGIPGDAGSILISSGGLEGIRLTLAVLLNPGDVLLLENPTYMSVLHLCREMNLVPVGVPTDRDGPLPDGLDARIRELTASGAAPRALYAIPSFQNPTGRTWSLERRRAVLEVLERHGLMVVEDHAYAELHYDADPLPALKALAPERTALVHTFSKTFGPGLRLGFVLADPEMVRRLGLIKLGTDQCSGTLVQRLALAYARSGALDRQVQGARALYREKRDAMLAAIRETFPEGPEPDHPAGGFFVWLDFGDRRLPADTTTLLREAVERHRVAWVGGACFFADPEDPAGARSLRLSFSFLPAERLREGARRVGAAIRGA